MTEAALRRKCRSYQRRLGMQEWRINCRYKPLSYIQRQVRKKDRNYYGYVDISLQDHMAEITICEPSEMANFAPDLPILETLAHELGHVLFDPMESLADDTLFELGLDRFAKDFVRRSR